MTLCTEALTNRFPAREIVQCFRLLLEPLVLVWNNLSCLKCGYVLTHKPHSGSHCLRAPGDHSTYESSAWYTQTRDCGTQPQSLGPHSPRVLGLTTAGPGTHHCRLWYSPLQVMVLIIAGSGTHHYRVLVLTTVGSWYSPLQGSCTHRCRVLVLTDAGSWYSPLQGSCTH